MFKNLREGITAIQDRDPAATNVVSALVNYPGLHALLFHRFNHWLHVHHLRLPARWGSQVARFLTGIEIHPGATIGRGFFIDHGMGVVIGETSIIGDNVTLYQGVTLGGTGNETGKRHPNIDDGAVVGVGACVLGDITVGANSKVGGGAVVVRDVPPNCTVVGIPAHVVRYRPPLAEITEEKKKGEHVQTSQSLPAELPEIELKHRHEDLPDPTTEVLATLMQRIRRLETEVGLREPSPPDSPPLRDYLQEVEDYATLYEAGGGI